MKNMNAMEVLNFADEDFNALIDTISEEELPDADEIKACIKRAAELEAFLNDKLISVLNSIKIFVRFTSTVEYDAYTSNGADCVYTNVDSHFDVIIENGDGTVSSDVFYLQLHASNEDAILYIAKDLVKSKFS